MGCRDQGHTPANDIASRIKLGIRQFGQTLFQFSLAQLERSLECSQGNWFPASDLVNNRDTKLFLATESLFR